MLFRGGRDRGGKGADEKKEIESQLHRASVAEILP
jgi:hypothetical protein